MASKVQVFLPGVETLNHSNTSGATLFVNEKIEIAKLLSKLRVDVCEAGFPIASQGDFEAVTAIAHEVLPHCWCSVLA